MKLFCFVVAAGLLCCSAGAPDARGEETTGSLRISVRDESGERLACRLHVRDQHGESQYADDLPHWKDHFVCSGDVEMRLAPGTYEVVTERGPEYRRENSSVSVVTGDEISLEITLTRISRLRDAGWFCGDLHVHRPVADLPLLMDAEDLDFAPVITWWNARNAWQNEEIPEETLRRLPGGRLYDVMAGEDEREGGALLYFGLKHPLNIVSENREFPSPMVFVERARRIDSGVWIDIEKPFWWDVPVWLASGRMNSIGLANNHMCRGQMYEDEAWGRPRDEQRLPPPRGNGYWTQEIYYHILDAGIRIPPSAGSASGVLPNPVGYNRVYVHLDEPFSRDAWFRGLARGESFVTNGPLLQVSANGHRPGTEIRLSDGESRECDLQIRTVSGDPLSQLEVIHNGRIVQTIDCGGSTAETHATTLTLDGPGWFLVRAIADVDHTFRFASTAPWYVHQAAGPPRISRRSAQFFLNWVEERMERVNANLDDRFRRPEVLLWHDRSKQFWTQRVMSANAD